MDFGVLVNYYIDQEADLIIVIIFVIVKDVSVFGIMKVNVEGFIEDFMEKFGFDFLFDWKLVVLQEYVFQEKYYLVFMGIYIFKCEFLVKFFDDYLDVIDFGKEIIFNVIIGGYKVVSYVFDEYWFDIGIICFFFEVNIVLMDNIFDFNLFDN